VKTMLKAAPTPSQRVHMARVLVVDDDPASRLTLQTILQAGGYMVESAASAAEAIDKLDRQEYQLVLSDLRMESPEAGYQVLAHARMMDYKPATALINTTRSKALLNLDQPMLIAPEDVPELMTKIANLISNRASKQVRRQMRQQTHALATSS
jgi:CheY-like chemotaxis protein